MKSPSALVRISGHFVAIFALVGFFLVRLWYSVSVIYVVEKDNYWITSPDWWKSLGFSDNAAMLAGLIPGIICGFCGFFVIVLASRYKSTILYAKGTWACLAAFLLAFYWMILTF